MKNMGCFNHYSNRDLVILFGGGPSTQTSYKSYQLDLQKRTLTSKARDEMAKTDRFLNHIFFKKDDSLYAFGEHFLHTYDLVLNKWSDEQVFPLNQ